MQDKEQQPKEEEQEPATPATIEQAMKEQMAAWKEALDKAKDEGKKRGR
jgi:hypothetical protein